jgi:NAD+ kinase
VRLHLLANPDRADALERARQIARWSESKGWQVAADQESAEALQLEPIRNAHFWETDLVVAFGGDGTLIRAAHLCSEHGTPILGVNFGTFGFVTQGTSDGVEAEIERFLAGQSAIDERMMIQTQLLRDGAPVVELHSLNESVLQRAADVRMLVFEVSVDGEFLTSYPADGVMVSTPTGSTAYNLSTGGPVMDPRIDAMIVSAIAPHTLSARPLVVSAASAIRIGLRRSGDAVISADGLTRLHLLKGDELRVTRSPRVTRLVEVDAKDFLRKLRDRLFWSKGMVEPA